MIPKKIWILWFQGFEDAPRVVQKCYQTWIDLNPEWEVVLLDETNVGEYVDLDPYTARQPLMEKTALADIFRAKLLEKYGGVWVDATCYCRRPLDEWLDEVTPTDFFVYSRPVKKSLVAIWFIAVSQYNPLMMKWSELTDEYVLSNPGLAQRPLTRRWFNRFIDRNPYTTRYWFSYPLTKVFKIYPYYWLMYLFAEVVRKDRMSNEIWKRTPKVLPPNPGHLHRYGLLSPLTEAVREEIDHGSAPLYKLSWRYEESKYRDDSVLAYILSRN